MSTDTTTKKRVADIKEGDVIVIMGGRRYAVVSKRKDSEEDMYWLTLEDRQVFTPHTTWPYGADRLVDVETEEN